MTRLTRRRALELTAVSSIAGLAGCLADDDVFGRWDGTDNDDGDADSDSDESSGHGSLGDPADAVDVTVLTQPSPQFDPGVVHVEPGGTVRWTVEGPRHTVTAYHPESDRALRIPEGAEPFHSELLREGHEFAWTFDEDGVYDYFDTRRLCGSHEALGAVGRVVVGWPDPESEPALQHDVAELPSRAETVMREYNEQTRETLDGA